MPRLQHKFQSSRVAAKCEKEGEGERWRESEGDRQSDSLFACVHCPAYHGHKRQPNRIEMHFELQHNNCLPSTSPLPCQPLVSVGVCVWQRTLHLAMHTHLRPLSINGQCRRGRERERGRAGERDCTRIKCNFHINFPLTAPLDAHKL